MLNKEYIFNKTMDNLMSLLRRSVENPRIADAFFHQAFGAVEMAILLIPNEEEKLCAMWEAWKDSYENFQKLWENA